MTKVKICGITRLEDARHAAECGADMLGLNFYKPSPRYIDPDSAAVLCDRLRQEFGTKTPLLVGVFVNEVVGNISAILGQVGLDAAQLSGDESDVMLKELRGIGFKAIQPMNKTMALDDVKYYEPYFPTDERLPSLVQDAYHPSLRGGTGEQTPEDVALAVKAAVPRLMLAGGLNPDNVADRVAAIAPWGVDVASGVESDTPGVKDHGKVKALIDAVLL